MALLVRPFFMRSILSSSSCILVKVPRQPILRKLVSPIGDSQCRPVSALLLNSQTCFRCSQIQFQSYGTHASNMKDQGIMARIKKRLGIKGKMKYKKRLMQMAGQGIYMGVADLIDHDQFIQELGMEDTFNSWFRISELHVWMALVRLTAEGQEGNFVRARMVEYMWQDLDKRTKKLGSLAGLTARREGIKILAQQFHAALYSYDEGLMGDDRVLAASLWRSFFEMKCDDPTKLEILVHYVRKQIHHLDQQDSEVLLTKGVMTFIPLHGNEETERT